MKRGKGEILEGKGRGIHNGNIKKLQKNLKVLHTKSEFSFN